MALAWSPGRHPRAHGLLGTTVREGWYLSAGWWARAACHLREQDWCPQTPTLRLDADRTRPETGTAHRATTQCSHQAGQARPGCAPAPCCPRPLAGTNPTQGGGTHFGVGVWEVELVQTVLPRVQKAAHGQGPVGAGEEVEGSSSGGRPPSTRPPPGCRLCPRRASPRQSSCGTGARGGQAEAHGARGGYREPGADTHNG